MWRRTSPRKRIFIFSLQHMKPLTLSTAIFLPFKFILTSFTVELTFRGRFKVEKTLHHCVCVKLNKLSSKVKRSIFTPHLSPSRPPFFPVWVKYLVNSCPLWPKQPSVPGLRVCLCELHSFTFL